MSKGSRVDQFEIGQQVEFKTDVGSKTYKREHDPDTGKMVEVFVRNNPVERIDTGTICKLQKSGRQGVAEIKPSGWIPGTGNKRLSRRLQHVTAIKASRDR